MASQTTCMMKCLSVCKHKQVEANGQNTQNGQPGGGSDPDGPGTSLSKLALVNSSELSRALVAASLTLLLGSSFLMPWMMAVRIWLAFSCSCSGSCRDQQRLSPPGQNQNLQVCGRVLTMSWQM